MNLHSTVFDPKYLCEYMFSDNEICRFDGEFNKSSCNWCETTNCINYKLCTSESHKNDDTLCIDWRMTYL